MIRWVLKKGRTRTSVHSPSEAAQQRAQSHAAALRTVAAVQLGAQLLLWVTFRGYDQAAQAVWQAALMLGAPLFALHALWRAGADAIATRAGAYVGLLLLPCLLLDAASLLYVLCAFIDSLIPEYPYAAGGVAVAAACYLMAVLPGRRGVAYGTHALRGGLIALFVLAVLLLRQSTRGDRLWPILAKGLPSTAMAALYGTGGVWAAALGSVLPGRRTPGRSWPQPAGAWLACVLWALWYGFIRPWAAGDMPDAAERLIGLSRHASSMITYQLGALLWLLLLPTALTGCTLTGEVVLQRAAPGLPRSLAALIVPALALAAVLAFPARLPNVLAALLPYRAALSAAAGLLLLVVRRMKP